MFCTGYVNRAEFLPEALQGSDPRRLYKHMFNPAIGGSLAFIGSARPGFGSQLAVMGSWQDVRRRTSSGGWVAAYIKILVAPSRLVRINALIVVLTSETRLSGRVSKRTISPVLGFSNLLCPCCLSGCCRTTHAAALRQSIHVIRQHRNGDVIGQRTGSVNRRHAGDVTGPNHVGSSPMENSLLIIVLAVGTLVAVIAIGAVQFMRNRQSQLKRGEKPGGLAGPDPD